MYSPSGRGLNTCRSDATSPALVHWRGELVVMPTYRKTCERMELWKNYFQNPDLWYDNRNSKYSSRSPDFKHKITNISLWVDGWGTPLWVLEEVAQREVELSSRQRHGSEIITRNDGEEEATRFLTRLKACAKKKDLCEGVSTHNDILKRGLLEKNPYVANTLITMYVKCAALQHAAEVLEQLPVQNIVSWNALIAGCVQHGQGLEALNCYEKMQKKGICPNDITLTCVLKACGNTKALELGKRIHDQILCNGSLKKYVMVGNALVDMYVKCGAIGKAEQVLEELPLRNVVSWNTLVSGYVQQSQCHEALKCLPRMQKDGLSPDDVTFACALKACGHITAIDKGIEIHNEIVNRCLLKKNVILGNALIDMYGKCGQLTKAKTVFEELPVRDIISWNALISGYVQWGQPHEAINYSSYILREGLYPNEVTYTCILKSCSCMKSMDKGKRIHGKIINGGLLGKSIMLGNALVDMYVKCGNIQVALRVFEGLPVRDVVSWNSLIAAFSWRDQGCKALNCYLQMKNEGLTPNEATIACLLDACGNIGAIEHGERIHQDIVSWGMLEKSIVLGTALLDMYANCGVLGKAQEVFEGLSVRDIVSWSALITGFARDGQSQKALNCFLQMQNEGIFPDEVAILCILAACSHSGHLAEAETYYENMSRKYGILPKLKHHTCLLTTFGCAGRFDKVISIIEATASHGDSSHWLALLRVCRKWENVELGKLVFDYAMQSNDHLAAASTLL